MDSYFNILKNIYKTRLCDEKMDILVKQNKGTSFFLSAKGHEIVGSVFSHFLDHKKDWAFPYYRDRAFAIGYGCPILDILAAFLARDIKKHSGGRMMLDHFSDKERKIALQSSVVGSQFLQATGVAKGLKLKKEGGVVYVSSGDGACSQGDFHEAMNFASIHQLPIIFAIQDNNFAISTPSLEQSAGGSVYNMVKNFPNIKTFFAEGSDIENFYNLAKKACIDAENGPCIFVAKVPRLGPHTISDDPSKYKNEKLIEEEKQKDPLIHLEKKILEKNIATEKDLENLKKEIKQEIEENASLAEKIPFPKKETACTKLFKKNEVLEEKIEVGEEKVNVVKALNLSLVEEMEIDDSIIVFGEDVAKDKGGVFQVTKNITKKFGENRCFNTPLAESTIIGISIGLSYVGFKPVCEIQFSDYCWTCVNQLLNEMSSIYYRSNGEYNCPCVIRMTYGGYVQGGPYHSQSLEAIFAHIPGIKIVIPSNAEDAYFLLKTAIKDPNPVVFLEHKCLYRKIDFSSRKKPISGQIPLGKANVVIEGNDITLVSWGMMTDMSFDVIKELKESVELIDLRTICPLDIDTILKSLKKTGKLLIVHEAWESCGFGSEIAAKIADIGFFNLDAPIKRVCAKNYPIPYSKVLEDEILPQKEDIKKAIFELLNF